MKKTTVVLSYICIALLAIGMTIALILLVGSDVAKAVTGFSNGIFGSTYAIAEVLVKATPLTLCGLGIAIGFRSGFTNLGAEGQLYMGAIAATSVALFLPGLPALITIPLMLLAGFLLGGIWALIPGFLKAKFKISEVIVTIMFNYIAINIVGILVRTILKDPDYPYPMSAEFPGSAILPTLLQPTRLHAGLIIAILCAVLIYILVWKTPIGFQMRAVGLNPRASQCSGISVYRSIILSALISGGLAGIAGVSEVAGLHHKLLEGLSPDYGYVAIIVALLGNNHPVGVVVAGLGIAALQVGSLAMQRSAGVPTAISLIFMGAIVLLILARKNIFSRLLDEEQGSNNFLSLLKRRTKQWTEY
jgi:ABC-type uncharacterized transport system permease subunit